MKSKDKNVLGTELKICSELPLTGFIETVFAGVVMKIRAVTLSQRL